MVRRHINRVKRTYTRARGILGASNILQNPVAMGIIAGAAKNIINGQSPINVQNIQKRISQPNVKNPLIYFILGHIMKNKPLQTIGAFLIVDPPAAEDIDDMSDEEIKALFEENEVDDDEEQKICIH